MKKKTSIKHNGNKIFRFFLLCFFILSLTSIIFSEDKPNEKVKLALERGRKLLEMVNARRQVLNDDV
jgi:hypothetical protein